MKNAFLRLVRSRLLLSCVVLFAGALAMWLRAADAPPAVPDASEGGYRYVGPLSHANLSIYMVVGEDRIKDKHYLTLAEAMEQKIINVHETGNVNQLTIENTSKDKDVYVQSGDIVKGGRQDRTIAMDFVCPPGAKLPIDAFCVEHGRWSQRGKEAAGQFSSADYQVSGGALKVAVKDARDQSEVWKQVDVLQKKAGENLGQSVQSAASSSSLQLSLEHKKLQETTEQYIKALSPSADRANTIGFAFAINGQVKSADVYASHELFMKLWPKLLRSAAVEAVADLQKGKTFDPPSPDMVKTFAAEAEKGKASDRQVTDRVKMQTRDGDKHLLYETRDAAVAQAASGDGWIHRNYLLKDEETKAALAARASGQQREARQQPAQQGEELRQRLEQAQETQRPIQQQRQPARQQPAQQQDPR